ncbi:MAG: lamin tail domain-containing protein [Myxococcales bacterium]|nr:lamin tail domain-containing protein [Myxococcales bacterium]
MRSFALLLVLAGCGVTDQPSQLQQALSSNVVISEVYGGGGSTNATFDSDFVELFNRGSAGVTVDGWTLQLATETSATWNVVPLSGSIEAGESYLVRLGAAGPAGAPLPQVDATGTAPVGISGGKVMLVSAGTVMNGVCPSTALIVDLVGYGPSATCFERARAQQPSSTMSLQRRDDGCVERDDNANDFVLAGPTPMPLSTAKRPCMRDAGAPGDGGFVEPDGGCQVLSVFPSVATRGGYDRVTQRSFARLFTQEPALSDGGMQSLSLEAAFFSGLGLPAMRSITSADRYSTCELCVTYGRRCTRGTCFEEFFAQSGEVSVSQADQSDAGRLAGAVTNVRFVRWDFANDRPVPGGQCVVIPSLALDVSWVEPQAPVDGGTAGGDAGVVSADGGVVEQGPTPGCGCSSTAGSFAFALATLLVSRRRR